ncbi:MAG: response regulator [Deltaproteobacteria bacterium]|nr:response regulator [Deltaproteobacteria bacterium]
MPKILVVDDNSELLNLLSSSFEEAGYTVQTATRGKVALEVARKDKPDLAVIDVLLPDVMGFDVAEGLKRLKVPFVFMSGVHKGGKAAANAMGTYGALSYFEKPFERKSLLEAVDKVLPARPKAQPSAPAWDVEAAPGVEGPADAMSLTGRIDLVSGATQASIRGKEVALKAAEAPAIANLQIARRPPPGPKTPPMMAPVAYVHPPSSIPPTPLAELLKIKPPPTMAPAQYAPPPPPPPTPMEPAPVAVSAPPPPPPDALQEIPAERGNPHQGELKDNLAQLFAAFLQAKETGELGLQRGQVRKIVYFEQGMPVFALSNLVADRLGQFLVRAGKIDDATLKSAAQEAHDTEQRTGDVLILMGLLTEQERLYYVGQQIKSILYSVFSWEEGTYQLSFQERARKESIKLDLHPATLCLRGIKKLYKLERMRRLLPDTAKPMPSQDPLFGLSDVELQGWEAHLIARCDGSRTVKDLVALSQKPEQDALGTLVALVSMKILEVR